MEVTFKILRYNPEKDKEPHYEMYRFEAHENMTVLDCLHKIKWEHDGSLAVRRSCAHGVCGSDGMRINGKNHLACSTLLKDLDTRKTITIEPLPSMPIVKDLILDMTDFYEKYYAVKPYLINRSPVPSDSERLQSNEDAEKLLAALQAVLQHGQMIII